ncbi:MAG: glycosyltransferase family 4 protein [Deltaproteobacteria bacterium]|nr:glycosyltransferase family 4 protein [Deltaproteobacteria bacterium]
MLKNSKFGQAAKKILILDTGKEWGGGTNSLIELVRRVDKKRYAMSALFYNNYKKGEGSDVKTELERLGVRFIQLDQTRPGAGMKALRETARSVFFLCPGLKKKYLFYFDFKSRIMPDAGRILHVIREGGFDLLYMNNQPSSNLEGIIAANAAGIPCIQHARIETSLNQVEAEAVNRLVARVICVSNGVRDGLTASGVLPSKCAVIYNGIDVTARPARGRDEVRKELGADEKTLVIGTVGSLIKRKRVALLLEAASMQKGAFCVVVGNGPEKDALMETAARLGIMERTRFTGFSNDALSYINAMDIFVLPSEKEGFPRVIMEAMLSARPVIAFNVAGAAEMILDKETGRVLADKGDRASAIASALRELASDRKAMTALGEAGRRRVISEFGIEKYAAAVSNVFDETLSGVNH